MVQTYSFTFFSSFANKGKWSPTNHLFLSGLLETLEKQKGLHASKPETWIVLCNLNIERRLAENNKTDRFNKTRNTQFTSAAKTSNLEAFVSSVICCGVLPLCLVGWCVSVLRGSLKRTIGKKTTSEIWKKESCRNQALISDTLQEFLLLNLHWLVFCQRNLKNLIHY